MRCSPAFRPRTVRAQQAGFTLVETIIAVALLGILSLSAGSAFKAFMTARHNAYVAEQAAINQKIANALMNKARIGPVLRADYADADQEPDGVPGTLQSPCTVSTSKVFYSIYNPGFTSTVCQSTRHLRDYLIQQGLNPDRGVNDDGTASRNVRLYQRVGGLTQDAFIFGKGGPKVTLNYDFGVVYLTNCGFNRPCNQTAASATNPPRSAPPTGTATVDDYAARLTLSNFTTWKAGNYDIAPVMVSTLPIQMELMESTAKSLLELKSAFQRYFDRMQAANPASTANFYPQPAFSQPPVSPAFNEGCREGWYALRLNATDVLEQIGLFNRDYPGEALYGLTAWGGVVEYCRDYDPSGTSPYGTPPHYAALRFNREVSNAFDPSPGQNIIISF